VPLRTNQLSCFILVALYTTVNIVFLFPFIHHLKFSIFWSLWIINETHTALTTSAWTQKNTKTNDWWVANHIAPVHVNKSIGWNTSRKTKKAYTDLYDFECSVEGTLNNYDESYTISGCTQMQCQFLFRRQLQCR
jgi:hypothetical protein